VLGAFGYRDEFPTAIELLRTGRVRTDYLVTDTFALERIAEGFERQLSKGQALKVMIQP
jgi:threonine dehydrogenase-like Zn-dependent dehydrogenase